MKRNGCSIRGVLIEFDINDPIYNKATIITDDINIGEECFQSLLANNGASYRDDSSIFPPIDVQAKVRMGFDEIYLDPMVFVISDGQREYATILPGKEA